jgi:dienelactone hydrolase
MNTLSKCLWVLLVTLSFQSHAQGVRVEKIDLVVKELNDLKVLADVRILDATTKPALVLVLPNAGGMDGTGPQYIRALNERGIATAEINPLAVDNWAHRIVIAKVTMRYAVQRLGIDPSRIGIMGFSAGGMDSLLAASEPFMNKLAPAIRLRFKAHAALYPLCGVMHDAHIEPYMNWGTATPAKSGDPNFFKGMFDKLTGGKILLLVGQKEDYEDAPTACGVLAQDLNSTDAGHTTELVVYPEAGHGWDVPGGGRTYSDKSSRKSSTIRHYRHQPTFEKSLAAVTEHFVRELAPR